MRIYAASRGDVVKGALYMIGFVAVLDVAMVLFLQHVAHRTVTFTAQWPIGVLLLGVLAYTIRAFNQAANSWIRVTPKQLSWASGPKPGSQGLTPSGSVKLSELTAVSVQSDEVKAKSGRKQVTLRVHRLHAEIEGKPAIVLPIAALESAADKYEEQVREQSRKLLLRTVVEINNNVTGFTVDTSVMGDVVLPGADANAEVVEASSTEAIVTETEAAAESEAVVTETVETESIEAEAVVSETVETETVVSEAVVTESVEAEGDDAVEVVEVVEVVELVEVAEVVAPVEGEAVQAEAEADVETAESAAEAEAEAEAAADSESDAEVDADPPATVIPAAAKSPEAGTATAETAVNG